MDNVSVEIVSYVLSKLKKKKESFLFLCKYICMYVIRIRKRTT